MLQVNWYLGSGYLEFCNQLGWVYQVPMVTVTTPGYGSYP